MEEEKGFAFLNSNAKSDGLNALTIGPPKDSQALRGDLELRRAKTRYAAVNAVATTVPTMKSRTRDHSSSIALRSNLGTSARIIRKASLVVVIGVAVAESMAGLRKRCKRSLDLAYAKNLEFVMRFLVRHSTSNTCTCPLVPPFLSAPFEILSLSLSPKNIYLESLNRSPNKNAKRNSTRKPSLTSVDRQPGSPDFSLSGRRDTLLM